MRSRLLLVALTLALVASLGATLPAQAGPVNPPPIDMATLREVPLRSQWGVADQDPAALHNFENYVWDFAEINGRIYVAGSFLNVQESRNGQKFPQPYLAAFDLYTGDWIPEFAPTLDGPVFALEISPLGLLLAGGQFRSADGLPNTAGVVALDPVTGRVDTRFQASVQRPLSTDLPVVRALEIVGNQLYIAGNFSHVRGNSDTQRVRVYKVARVNARWGNPDGTWKPQVAGAGIYGMAVDAPRGRVHLGGFFSSVNGAANTFSYATVDTTTGALVPNLAPWQQNYNGRNPRKVYDVAASENRVFVGGEEHMLQVLDGTTRQRLGFHTTGHYCDTFMWAACGRSFFGGGDFQVVERVGDWVIAGCHCTYESRNGTVSWYDSFANTRRRVKLAGAVNVATGQVSTWSPDLAGSRDGIWAAHSDSLGCLLLGGQFDVAGVEAGQAFWVGNWARFCPPGVGEPDRVSPTAPTNLVAAADGADVVLTWDAGTDNLGVASYIVIRDGVEIATVDAAALTYRDVAPTRGWHTYKVKTVDHFGNRSPNSSADSVQVLRRR